MGEYTTTSDLYRVVILYLRNGEECLSVVSETPQLGMALNGARQLIKDGLIPGQINIMSLSPNTEGWQPLWGSDFDFQTQDQPIFTFF